MSDWAGRHVDALNFRPVEVDDGTICNEVVEADGGLIGRAVEGKGLPEIGGGSVAGDGGGNGRAGEGGVETVL